MSRRRSASRKGAVVGGTSAGASVMAELIDQHFLKRQRNNRLLSAVLEHPNLVGVGIDEATAVILREGMSYSMK
jgi:cyanophycinase-like exopeptidase